MFGDSDKTIALLRIRLRDEDRFCAKCDHTGRIFFLEKGLVSYDKCECFIKLKNMEAYPRLLSQSRLPHMAWGFNLSDYKNTGVDEQGVAANLAALAQLKEDCALISLRLAEGRNWYVQGGKGTGKTILASQLAKYAMVHGSRAAYTQLAELATLSSFDLEEHVRNWRDYIMYSKLLIVDGIDAYSTQSGFHERVFDDFVRMRIQNRLSCVFISSTPRKFIANKLGDNNASLMRERCTVITFLGRDFRAEPKS